MCLSHFLPFNFIEDNNDFYAAVQELSNSTADSLRYLSEKVFQPFESDYNEYEELNDIDPDFNFFNAMSQNRCCNYYLESSFNNMINKTKEKNIFSLCHLNIRSMKKNIAQFESFLDLLDHDFTVVGLTETWLNECDCNLYKLDGYSIVENHRECRVGGGVALLVRDWLTVAERDDICVYNSDIESVFVEIDKDQIRSSKNIVIGTIYRPPGQDIDNFNLEINKILDKLHKENKTIYIMGDFNINLMNSDTHTPTGSFLDLMYSNMLFPLITRPTRVTANSATLIDNIFTNNTCGTGSLIQGVFVTDITDHYPIFHIDQELTCEIVDDVIVKRIYNSKNMREFSETLSHTDWSEMYTASGTQEAFDLFHNKLMELHNKHFPKVRIKKGYSNRKPWLSEALRDCIKRKNKMYYVFKKVPSVNNEICYKKYRNKLNHILLRAEKQYYHDLLNKHKGNLRKSWGIIKNIIHKNKKSLNQSKFQLSDGNMTSDKKVISGKFNDFFVNVGPMLAKKIPCINKSPLSYMTSRTNESIFLSPVTPVELEKMLLTLKNSATGWDEINAMFLKTSLNYIRDPLCHICNMSLEEGIFPSKLKIANVLPLFKAEEPSQFNNYRPVSLLCILSKVFEKIMYNRLSDFITKLELLYEFQFGFRKKHSTYLAHLILLDKLTNSLDNGEKVIGIYLDFSKAFDTVNHDILLQKLYHYGIRGNAYEWFKSYLTGRVQYVTYNRVQSSSKQITCGVPQGSILGPLLFLIYINDLPNVCDNTMPFLFADDTNLFISGENYQKLYEAANNDLNAIAEWLKVNRLSLNVKKTHYMVFSNTKITSANNELKIEGETISEVTKTKFLGVIIDNRLNWQHHINYISSKVAKGLGIIIKVRKVLDNKSLLSLYYAFIYPYLMYCNHVWGNACSVYLNKLNVLQKKVVRIIAGVKPRTSTADLFHKLDIMKVNDLNIFLIAQVMYHVYTSEVVTVFRHLFSTNRNIHTHETRQSDHFNIPLYHKNIGKSSIRYRGAVIWNNVLKIGIELNCSKKIFKQHLKSHISAGSIKDQLYWPYWEKRKKWLCAMLSLLQIALQYQIWYLYLLELIIYCLSIVALSLHPLIIFNFPTIFGVPHKEPA